MFYLQIGLSRLFPRARECPRVPALMYPPRTRTALSVYRTSALFGSKGTLPCLYTRYTMMNTSVSAAIVG